MERYSIRVDIFVNYYGYKNAFVRLNEKNIMSEFDDFLEDVRKHGKVYMYFQMFLQLVGLLCFLATCITILCFFWQIILSFRTVVS